MDTTHCRCGRFYSDCPYPVSHSHPTVNHVKLPAKLNGVLSHGGYPRNLTLQDRRVLDTVRVHDNTFSTELEVPIYG